MVSSVACAAICRWQSHMPRASPRTPAVRCAQRNVVDLVQKLRARGLLGDSVIHTATGREYLTKEHLRQQVRRQGSTRTASP